MTKKLKKHMYKTITGTILFIICFFLEKICEKGIYIFFSVGTFDFSILFLLFLITYFVIGYDVVIKALKNIINMQMLDENFLMVLATVGAFFVGDYPEAVAVMVFYQIGEFFQKYAVTRARNSIKELMEICPDEAIVIRNGTEEKVCPDEVLIKEKIVVRPGEKIPLDGIIVKGNTSLDTKALTGESLPRDVAVGDYIYSGTINLTGVIEVEVCKEFSDSTVSKILELVENAQTQKGKSERFITRFAHWYTPLVVVCAVVLAVVYPLFKCVCGIETLTFGLFKPYIYRALTFLVISCPCALVISIPLSFFGGIGGASKCGILIKGSNYLENLCKARIVVTDKTGTLTEGRFEVSKVKSLSGEYSENQIIYLLKQMEKYSNHPLAKTICNYNISNESAYNVEILDICEEAGKGISGTVNGQRMIAGNNKILLENDINLPMVNETGTIIYLANENSCIGYCILEDKIKDDSVKAVENMKKNGIKEVIMLTGDNRLTGEKVGEKIGITKVYSELLPDDKVNIFEQILSQKDKDEMIVYVGDGINDAPVLARADIGIAMGGLGSDAAIEAADIVIMDDKPSKVVTGIKIANKTVRIVRENIVFAIGVKILILIFAALGLAGMWWAIFADVGVAVIAILNAMRALYIKVSD